MGNSFHKSCYGVLGANLPCDIDGYVPTDGCGAFELNYDHAGADTHDENGVLTEYGSWWKNYGFPDKLEEAVNATLSARIALNKWRDNLTE